MARNSYHSCVRVGNWYENKLMEEDLQKHIERTQSAEKNYEELLASLLEEGEVSVCPDGLLHFGDTVIIHAPVVQPRKGSPVESFPCTLQATPSKAALLKNVYHEVPITAHPQHHRPILKNVFTILPRTSAHPMGSELTYGAPFNLVHTTPRRQRLYVTSPVGSALHSGRESRRQEVLLQDEESAHSAWRLQPSDPALRLTYEGQPVEVGARVRILQTMTNQPLVVEEEFSTKTIYGPEQQVSVGVVNRATTRAAHVLCLLTWTRRTPTQEEIAQEQARKQQEEEDVMKEERERQRRELEEEEERRREAERELEEKTQGMRLVLDNDESEDEGERGE
ncbi:cilia- and flagella-associated protein 161 [Penaeus vannamei]|uniref:cilia- and flagella-associated protein 161 n=1 Tax=Penaeus vannamei TaxID=6689 RepID=UPI00387F86F0